MVFWRKQKEMPEETVEEIIEEPPAPPPAEEEPSKWVTIVKLVCIILLHILFISYFIWCTVVFIRFDKEAHCAAAANTSVNTTQELDPFVILCSYNWCIGYGFLIILCVLVYGFVIYFMLFKPYVGAKLYDKSVEPIVGKWMKFSRQKLVSIILLVLVLVVVFGFIFYTTRHNIKKARGIAAPIFFILMGYIFSKHRKAIPWRIVVHGLLLQFIIGVIILRWKHGYRIIFCVGDKLVTLLKFTSNGARFVYGDQINDEFVFAFTITAIIFFFSVLTSCLYYLGLIPRMLRAFGGVLQSIVGTTVCESVLAVTNVFLSMSESPLIILPYLERLTNSELHCICVSGYATIAGSVLGAYISIGATPAYLIAASVMAAPASLGYSKLFYPETEESLTKSENIKMEASRETSLLDAALSGAFNAISIVLGIVSNAIAFISVVALINSIVQWIFMLAGDDDTTFIELLGKALMPLAFLMGVPWHDCAEVGQVFAMKIVINAFVGYKKLAQLIKDDHLDNQSDAIATFAICGFSNIISMSITIASLTALAPSRRADIAHVAFRAIFVGIIVSYTSASYAGILLDDETIRKIGQNKKNFF